MQQMFGIAKKEGINIRWRNFRPALQGMYWAPREAPPVIFLSNALEGHTRLMRSVMAEELGHHYTLENECLCRTYYSYRDRLDVSRAEYRALRWAAKYLIPQDKLEKVIRSGMIQRWDLAEAFDVVEDLVPYRMAMPDAVKICFEASRNRIIRSGDIAG